MKTIVLYLTLTILPSAMYRSANTVYPPLKTTIESLSGDFSSISPERREQLQLLSDYIGSKIKNGEKVQLIFICTHNSRRSHISQIWAQTAAGYYAVPNVFCYSGGTEATAFNPRAIKAMEAVGFKIDQISEGANPVYEVTFGESMAPIKAYSKKYNDLDNPSEGFAAIMTCSHADSSCPIVAGAEDRIAIPYDDPKAFDGTALEKEKYLERVNEIGREMLYVFASLKSL